MAKTIGKHGVEGPSPSGGDLAIETLGLTKAYHGRAVVDNLDMHVPEGHIYGFVGRNGAGKTTTMRMIAGLTTATGGSIRLQGVDARNNPVAIGSLIEEPGILPNLTGRENLMAKAIAMGVKDAGRHCDELLDLVGLANVGKKKAKGFSLGMKQRLGLASALVGNPRILLLDEPLNGLDPEGTRAMRSALSRLSEERGVTMVISSHVLDQLNRVADHFGVIARGRMVAEFTDDEMQNACRGAVRVRATDPELARSTICERLPQLAMSMAEDGALSLMAPEGTPDVEAISRALHEAGVILLELVVVQRDIEDYFVELMGRGSENA